ncbi:MAG: acyl-CoA dehydrogenase family protein [Dehalococcoidia bacterium]|nr:acyl-CoA dehydrogenase family protein [Dehalococcoidia bacterium]
MDFGLSEEQTMIISVARQLADDFEEEEKRLEEEGLEQSDSLKKKLAQLNFTGMTLSSEYGGQGYGNLEAVLVLEQLARKCPSLAGIFHETNFGPVRQIDFWGSDYLKGKYIPPVCNGDTLISIGMTEPEAGSALTDLKTKAELRGDYYILNGQKRFVSAVGVSDSYMVFVRLTEERGARGIGTIIVDKDTTGFKFGRRERMMGHNTMAQRDLIFEDAFVPKGNLVLEAGGFAKAMLCFDVERVGNGTISLGIGQGALESSIEYSQQRYQFGKPICEFQAVQFMLADMTMMVEAARLLLYKAASNSGKGFPSRLESSVAKCYSNEMAKKVTDLALELFGGYGYSKDYPIEILLRDSRGWAIAAGTPQMQRIGIASDLLKRRFDQRR